MSWDSSCHADSGDRNGYTDQNADTLETGRQDLDDCGGEVMGHVLNLLMANGARGALYADLYKEKQTCLYSDSDL